MGNPNGGKTSLFNYITGLQQKTGNFPGVTVDIMSAEIRLATGKRVSFVDFPGLYNLYPTSRDEKMVVQSLLHTSDPYHPDLICYVADVTCLEKHFLLLDQLRDLGIPLILLLTMMDVEQEGDLAVDTKRLETSLNLPIVAVNGRNGSGVEQLMEHISLFAALRPAAQPGAGGYTFSEDERRLVEELGQVFPDFSPYKRILLAHHAQWIPTISAGERIRLLGCIGEVGFRTLASQVREVTQRYRQFGELVNKAVRRRAGTGFTLSERVDGFLTNRIFGLMVFLEVLTLMFQALYTWAAWPMTLIEGGFAGLSGYLSESLPPGMLTRFLTEGLLAGLGGILVFIPQIALLFFLISILEEIGYMARAAFLFDRIMQFFGMNGRSMVALISGGACAIPAIMSTRTISSWKERLITIMVTPFISCSARIPVYTVLIGLVIPARTVGHYLNLQGLAFLGLYLLGIFAALFSALMLKWWVRSDEPSYLLLELPDYRFPVWRNVGLTVWEKVKTFTLEAGKIILVLSLIIWFLANHGPRERREAAAAEAARQTQVLGLDRQASEKVSRALQLEASYAGILGKTMEPVIRPLGFDWKIGIALLTSFAAREVFVATMATIYSLGQEDSERTLRQRLASERNEQTGRPRYDLPTGVSLLLFYVFAMQCMSTLAVVRRETRSWKWPLLQFAGMTVLAYLASFFSYQLLQ